MLRLAYALPAMLVAACLCYVVAARAADPMFTVNNIHVDASAASVSEAQGIAFSQGRPKAWQTLYRRITRQQDWDKQPVLDDTQIQRLIRSFVIAHERRSTTRYVADISYEFNPQAVEKTLKDANIAFTAAQAKRILLIPMDPGFTRGSPWANAFAAPRFANALVPFSLPVGDAMDQDALHRLNFEQATWPDVEALAERVHATEAVLVLAQPNRGKLTLVLKRLGIGEQPTTATLDVPYVQGPQTTFPAAADAALNAITDMWKQKVAVDFSQRGKLTADVRIASLSQWASVQAALASVPNVSSVSIVAMDIGEARITIAYLGTIDQFRDALGQASLVLTSSGGEWVLRQGQPSPQPAAASASTP
jgi:hypothetical protein